jgi:hypothetical protein
MDGQLSKGNNLATEQSKTARSIIVHTTQNFVLSIKQANILYKQVYGGTFYTNMNRQRTHGT